VTSLKLPPECRSVSEQSASWSLFSRSHLLSRISSHTVFCRARRSKRSPPATVLIRIPDPRAPSQTYRAPPFSSQGGSAPRSGTLGSPPGSTRRSKTSRSAMTTTPLRSSTCAVRIPKDGAIAVPSANRLRSRRAVSAQSLVIARLRSVRFVAWLDEPAAGKEAAVLEERHGGTRIETPGGETRAAGSLQLAVGSEREARGRGVSIGQLVNLSIGEGRETAVSQAPTGRSWGLRG
jgi:hypothetical protein